MNEKEKLAELLKRSFDPLNHELKRDLWPQMQRRLSECPSDRHWLAAMFSSAAVASVPWFDWALLAVLVLGFCIFPSSIPIWLYHF